MPRRFRQRLPGVAASVSNYVVTSLNSPEIVDVAVYGSGGVAEGAETGVLIIDMSPIDPDATRRLAARAAEKGPALSSQPVVRRAGESAGRRTHADGVR